MVILILFPPNPMFVLTSLILFPFPPCFSLNAKGKSVQARKQNQSTWSLVLLKVSDVAQHKEPSSGY